MYFIDFLRILEGYVTIQADSVFPERFLTVCTRRNLEIWDVRHRGEGRLTANMSLRAFRSIRPVCRRTQTHLTILKRKGLPFLLYRYRKRKLLLPALALVVLFLWYTSGHIMGITVFGNNRIPTATILEHLARSDIAIGRSTAEVDSSVIRNRMMRDLEDLAWLGINVSGSRIYVEVVERLETEAGIDPDVPCNLIAEKDGVIVSIEARDGQTVVTPSSGVRAGDVLVSGIMDAGESGIRYVHAYGEIFAHTFHSLTREYPLTYTETLETGNDTTRYTLKVLNWQLPLFLRKSAPYAEYAQEETEQEYRLPIERLPSLYVKKSVFKEQTSTQKERSAAEALATGKEELLKELTESIPEDATIIQQEVSHTLTERGGLSVTVTLTALEDIAIESPIANYDGQE